MILPLQDLPVLLLQIITVKSAKCYSIKAQELRKSWKSPLLSAGNEMPFSSFSFCCCKPDGVVLQDMLLNQSHCKIHYHYSPPTLGWLWILEWRWHKAIKAGPFNIELIPHLHLITSSFRATAKCCSHIPLFCLLHHTHHKCQWCTAHPE